ncbi:hypothetical protein PVT68_03090 [Microbulbifer bruguierae]|uniref:Sulfotransferase family protein n=1 Tax=Microbulbifer bruguierae TaxID=3029061 RepID=A0ABY8NEE1_9GAMM|nr:hypothetical protein [Microbulbifer bruguierae]WGL17294.1 hypothetical protein PVT68_03090 [Microbulbifer bruguierae]
MALITWMNQLKGYGMSEINIRNPALVYIPKGVSVSESSSGLPKTVVIFGVPRGGTTMVAGVVQRLGVDLGEDLPVNLEDPAFNGKSIEEMLQSIFTRNRCKKLWGWKFPRARSYLEDIQEYLVRPHYIIVWRDVLANATRLIGRGSSVIEALNHAHTIQRKNIDVLDKLNGPCLLVSYEKAILNPEALARQISKFIDVNARLDIDELLSFSQPGTYKAVIA